MSYSCNRTQTHKPFTYLRCELGMFVLPSELTSVTQKNAPTTVVMLILGLVQGQPLGFDTKYLALGDRNMQVRFSLKVVWVS